ncbi:hypothetical protein [Halomonas kalidii]|uniref:Uncharacterized protein n=1 Tax=Halomonas kalidii TaxID=3043293 RepID=A0ABT6VGS7_9GAMM|nr:hypothetical protein [Halomonas kalidii]MDI5933172.1 hypothetical protein [Halomonas kalidii]
MIKELVGLVIRTAAVSRANTGYIYAGDLVKEGENIPYTRTLAWVNGRIEEGECNYDAHSVCIVDEPERALVDVSEDGFFGVVTKGGNVTGDIFETSAPRPSERRVHGIESVCEVAGKAYAVGLGGVVYRMDKVGAWTRIDEGLPGYVNLAAISGFGDKELYVVGENGEVWSFDGVVWRKIDVPTNRNLLCVKCGADGVVYIGGKGGVTIRGSGHQWGGFCDGDIEDDIWDLEWFGGELFASTMKNVYRYGGSGFQIEDFGEEGVSCYQLSASGDVMWSNGERDVMQYDGSHWTRIV